MISTLGKLDEIQKNTNFVFGVCGDRTVGKTSIINRIIIGEFTTVSNNVSSVKILTNKGLVNINLIDGVDNTINGAIIMFDYTNKSTYDSIPGWFTKCNQITNNIVLCGNKCDSEKHQVISENITHHLELGIKYFDISAKSCYNLERPILELLKKLLGDDTILVDI